MDGARDKAGASQAHRLPSAQSQLIVEGGAMNKVTQEIVVRGSAAAVGLVALVSVVGAGVKWNN